MDSLKSICKTKQNTTQIGFTSSEFDQNIHGDFKKAVDDMAIQKIKENIEGRCIGSGYVIPNTVKLIERSTITFPHEALQLHYSMRVHYEYVLCNPNPGAVLKCKVVTKNKIGILGRLEHENSPLVILVPGDLCNTPEKETVLKKATQNDIIEIVVIAKKFEQNDKKITVIAEISV